VHEEWTDKLSEYLDGELPDGERRAVDEHLRGCAECSAVLADLKRVVARAQGVGTGVPRPPSVDLWSGIAARIEASSTNVVSLSRRSADAARADVARRITFTLPQLAAAAVLIAAVSGGVVWSIVSRPEGLRYAPATRDGAPPDGAPSPDVAQPFRAASPDAAQAPSGEPRVVTVGMSDPQYDAAVSDLEKAVKQGRGKLDASTIAIVEHNLQIIDQAIDQAREALAADPANSYLSGHLVEARRRKLDLLRRAAALTSESD